MVYDPQPDAFVMGGNPELLFGEGDVNPTVRLQILEFVNQTQARPSGKHIHVELPGAGAMKLLAQLEAYRLHMGLPMPEIPNAVLHEDKKPN